MTKFKNIEIRPLLSFALVAVFSFFAWKGSANATSASVTVSGNTGLIQITASGTFTRYENCGTASPPHCYPDDSGNVTLRTDDVWANFLGYESGKGSVQFTEEVDAGKLSQGPHTFTAEVRDSKFYVYNNPSPAIYASQTIIIDNKPEISITTFKHFPDKTWDVIGTVTFKDCPTTDEGNLYISIEETGADPYFPVYGRTKLYNQGGGKFSWKLSEIIRTRLSNDLLERDDLMLNIEATATNRSKAIIKRHLMRLAHGCPEPIQ